MDKMYVLFESNQNNLLYKQRVRPAKERRLRRFHGNLDAITDLSECWNIKIKTLKFEISHAYTSH